MAEKNQNEEESYDINRRELKDLYETIGDDATFNRQLKYILEKFELIEEKKYAKWLDQKGRVVYPGLLSMKEMKIVLPRKLGYFQKKGRIYSLPLIPSRGKIQKEFKKYYRRSFAAKPR